MTMPDLTMEKWASTIGSISTAVAAFIALAALLVATSFNRRQLEAASATEIRRDVVQFGEEFTVLIDRVHDVTELYGGVTGIQQELAERLGSSATPRDFWAYFSQEDAMNYARASIVVAGWNKSQVARDLRAAEDFFQRAAGRLTGHLQILVSARHLQRNILRDTYSARVFSRLVATEEFAPTLEDSLEGVGGRDAPLFTLQSALGNLLYDQAYRYYTPYDRWLEEIGRLVQELVKSLSGLSDRDLIRLSRERGVIAEEEGLLQDIRKLFDGMKENLSLERRSKIEDIIVSVEREYKATAALN